MRSEVHRTTQRLIAVLGQLDVIAADNIVRSQQIKERIDHLLEQLEAGETLPSIVESEEPPLIPSIITANIEALQDVGARFRKAQATALRAHGYTMEEIATLFGVTRQRISTLLDEGCGRAAPR